MLNNVYEVAIAWDYVTSDTREVNAIDLYHSGKKMREHFDPTSAGYN